MRSREIALDGLPHLGVASGKRIPNKGAKRQENALVEFLCNVDLSQDMRFLEAVLVALEKYSDLFYVDALKKNLTRLNEQGKKLLAGVAKKRILSGDHRWKSLYKKIYRTAQKGNDIEVDSWQLRKGKEDPEFLQFGIKVIEVRPASEAKLLRREYILKNQTWFKNRAIYGVGVRADIMSFMELELGDRPYRAMKFLGCSQKSAYDNWRAIEEIRSLGLLA